MMLGDTSEEWHIRMSKVYVCMHVCTYMYICLRFRIGMLLQGGDLTDTLFDSLGSTETLSAGDVAVLFSAASTLLTNEAINNETVSNRKISTLASLNT